MNDASEAPVVKHDEVGAEVDKPGPEKASGIDQGFGDDEAEGHGEENTGESVGKAVPVAEAEDGGRDEDGGAGSEVGEECGDEGDAIGTFFEEGVGGGEEDGPEDHGSGVCDGIAGEGDIGESETQAADAEDWGGNVPAEATQAGEIDGGSEIAGLEIDGAESAAETGGEGDDKGGEDNADGEGLDLIDNEVGSACDVGSGAGEGGVEVEEEFFESIDYREGTEGRREGG